MTRTSANSGVPADGLLGALRLRLRDSSAQRVGAVLALIAAPFFALWSTTASLAAAWSDPLRVELSHGYLIVLVVAWLIWRRRVEIAELPARPNRLALFALALLSIVWLALQRSSIQIGHQVLLPVISAMTVCAALGWSVTQRTLFPLGYFYLAIPLWTVLSAPLQWSSVLAVRGMMRLVGIPVYFSGASFEIPAGVFEIADGCSGLRLMVVGLAIAILYGELLRASLAMRVLLVALAVLLSGFANWLRIFIIIGAGHLYGLDHLLVKDHIWFGWLVFAVVMVVFFWIANRIPAILRSADPVAETNGVAPGIWATGGRHLLLTGVALSLAPAWAATQSALNRYDAPSAFSPPSLSGWDKQLPASDRQPEWQPQFAGVDRELRVAYLNGAREIELYAGSYREQRQGKELSARSNSVFGRERVRVESTQIQSYSGVPSVQRIVQGNDGQRWLYWHSYRIGDAWLVEPLLAQLRYGITSLWRIPESQVMVLRTRCNNAACSDAAQDLLPLWAAAVREL